MTREEVQNIRHGIYRIYWSKRKYSLASVGSFHNGDRWFACSNWTSENASSILGYGKDWEQVNRVVLIESR